MNDGMQLIAMALVINPILKGLNDYRKEWCAYSNTGEYNLDVDPTTDDWAEKRDPATGQWSLIKITGYKKPCWPGSGHVEFKTLDQYGDEHTHTWRLVKWFEDRENRRSVSNIQADAILKVHNRWPARRSPARVDNVAGIQQQDMVVILRDFNKMFGKINELLDISAEVQEIKSSVIPGAISELQVESNNEIAASVRDAARSIDGLKATVQYLLRVITPNKPQSTSKKKK